MMMKMVLCNLANPSAHQLGEGLYSLVDLYFSSFSSADVDYTSDKSNAPYFSICMAESTEMTQDCPDSIVNNNC